MKFFLFLAIFFILLFTCGCISQSPMTAEKNIARIIELSNSSQNDVDQMVIADPNNSTAWCIRGMHYNNAFGQYDEALKSYDRGLELDSKNGLCWYAKGTTLRNMKQFKEAEICFENAKKNDPGLFV